MARYQPQAGPQQYWQQQGPVTQASYHQQVDYNAGYSQHPQQHGFAHQQFHQQQMGYAAQQHAAHQQQPRYAQQPQSRSNDVNTPNARPSKRMRGPEQLLDQPQQQFTQVQQRSQAHRPKLNGVPAAAGQLPKCNYSDPAAAAVLDDLQDQIAAFAARAVPTPQEQASRDEALRSFRSIAAQALPDFAQQIRVELFGSGAAGLALHSSDLDVMIQGLAEPNEDTGQFETNDKYFVVQCLRKVERIARFGSGKHILGVVGGQLIGRARIPVLKLNLESGLEMDISINGDGGIKAARFLRSFQQDFAAVQPLTLLLKCCLKQRQLADVATGGLGSWSLVNMVIAHLMTMDKQREQVDHLGSMLLSFLKRYGVDFDVEADAVAVKRGGIIGIGALDSRFRQRGKLALEDPLTGREVAGGSHRYADVQATFQRLYRRLFDCLADAKQRHGQGSSTGISGSSEQHGRGSSSSRHRVFDDDADEWGYDAANRSPTYAASIRQRHSHSSSTRRPAFSILEELLDTRKALDRPEGETAAAAANGAAEQQFVSSAAALLHGNQTGGGHWQWGTGRSGAAAVSAGCQPRVQVGSKRDRWHAR